MRAMIYARYSTDMQREASIADQIEICRRYIERNGWTLTGHYGHAARTGTTRRRPGFPRFLADAEAGQFDVVVCQSLDRLGCKLAGIADTSDRLIFARVQLSEMQAALEATRVPPENNMATRSTLGDVSVQDAEVPIAADAPMREPAERAMLPAASAVATLAHRSKDKPWPDARAPFIVRPVKAAPDMDLPRLMIGIDDPSPELKASL